MEKILAIFFLISVFNFSLAQNNAFPSWYLDEIASEVGVWKADNSNYKSENEPYDEYAIEWKWSPIKNHIYGRLYGLIDGKDAGSFWDFHKYWDPAQNKVTVMQIGRDGALGTGTLNRTGENKTELVQVFTGLDGSNQKAGHRTTKISESEETGTSFDIAEKNEWIPRRTYTWKKQDIQDSFDKDLAEKLSADDYGMSRYVFVFLKKGPQSSQDKESAAKLQNEHLKKIIRLADEGKLVLAGPFLDNGDYRGIFILNVQSVEEARVLVDSDPMIATGVLEAEFHPWYGSAVLKMVNEWHGKVALKSIMP